MEEDGTRTLAGESRERALQALWFDWDEAYMIDVTGDEWRARRHDGLGGWITAGTPGELRRLIWDDFAAKPVPHESRIGSSDPGEPAGDS